MKTREIEETTHHSRGLFETLFNSVPGSLILGSLIISISILLSGGVIKIKGFNGAVDSPAPQAGAPDIPSGPVRVNLDDDPVLGDKNAPVTLVDFSDYECPFCKRHFDQTYPQLKKDYIDTGKVKMVYRDLPLSFHQNAHKEAEAAECARDQGGDIVYFKYHDEIFKRTTSNGTGLALDKLPVIAKDLGLNGDVLQKCLDSEKYKAEVDKDIADAAKYGATGTPSFFIGKSAGSEIEGTILIGAQPYSAFKTIIDQQLR